MSNPSVITLFSKRNAGVNLNRIDIEDNIGESIHVHLNQLRLDFSIDDYLEFSSQVLPLFVQYLRKKNIPNFFVDPYFLSQIFDLIPSLYNVTFKTITLSSLLAILHSSIPLLKGASFSTKISHSSAFKFLSNTSNQFTNYEQANEYHSSNSFRLQQLLQSIKERGYDENKGLITLFGDQLYIRDGLHRACVLYHLYGPDYLVKVQVLHFSNAKSRFSQFKPLPYILLRNIVKISKRKLFNQKQKIFDLFLKFS